MAEEPVETSGARLELKGLSDVSINSALNPERVEGELSDAELLKIAGQGLKASLPEEIEGADARIILWDEAGKGVIKICVSTGHGNSQRNTLSIQGR